MRLVILPQALRVIIPPLTNQYLNLTKNSSLAVAIGYPDVVSIANTTLNQTGRAVECIAIIMLVYLTHLAQHLGADELVQQARGHQGALMADRHLRPRSHRGRRRSTTEGLVPWLQAQPVRRLAELADHRSLLDRPGAVPAAAAGALGGCSRRCSAPDADACQAARGTGACWGVVTEKYRFILFGRYPFEEQWRPELATRADGGGAGGQLHALVLEALAGAAVGRWCWPSSSADVRRRVRPDAGAHRPLGRPAADGDAGHAVDLPGLPDRGAGGAGPAQPAAGDPHRLRDLRRADPRRAADHRAVHGLVHVPAVHAAGHEHRRAAARAGRHHAVCRGLHGRDRARRPAGHPQGPARGGRHAGPELLADAAQDRAAAGAGDGGAEHHEQLHQHLQGHLAGDHRHPVRADRRARPGAELRRRLAAVQDRGLPVHRRDLLRLLLRHVALQPVGREAGRRSAAPAERATIRKPS